MSEYTLETFTEDIKYFFEIFTTIINQHFDENDILIKQPSNSKIKLLLENRKEFLSFNLNDNNNFYYYFNSNIFYMEHLTNRFVLFYNHKNYYNFFMTCHYLSNDYSFLDKYSNEVKSFFIKHFKIITHPLADFDETLHMKNLLNNVKTIRVFTDICKVYFENDFLDYKFNKSYTDRELRIINLNYEINRQQQKRNLKINEMILKNNIRTVKLIFKFTDINKEYEISNLFLTDDYFNSNSFNNIDRFEFIFEFDFNKTFYDSIILYFTKCEIDKEIDGLILNDLFVFADQYQLDLLKILDYLSKIDDSYNSDLNTVKDKFIFKYSDFKYGEYDYYESIVDDKKFYYVLINNKKHYIGILYGRTDYCNICENYPLEIRNLDHKSLSNGNIRNFVNNLNNYFDLINEPIDLFF